MRRFKVMKIRKRQKLKKCKVNSFKRNKMDLKRLRTGSMK